MAVFNAIRTVLAIREFQDTVVPPEMINQIIEAGRLSGSSMNLQPWHFIVVQKRETLQQIGAVTKYGPYVAQAPVAIVVVIDRSVFAISDASRAIQSMILTAWDAGIGSNWVGFVDFEGSDSVNPLLGIPAGHDILAILPFGYPAKEVGQGKKKRKPVAEVVSGERFGEPW
jgi:nitroreductase